MDALLPLLVSWTWWGTVTTAALLLAAKLWVAATSVECHVERRLDGRVALVTGGSGGIGYQTALDLARRGAEVVITARNMSKGEDARDRIRLLSRNKKVHLRHLDVSSMKQVRQFARYFCRDYPKLHCLVNNAGTIHDHGFFDRGVRRLTEDGFEVVMATNYLGPFLLTELLLPSLKTAAEDCSDLPCRVINVSSIAHIYASLLGVTLDLNSDQGTFNAPYQYGLSKLAQIIHTRDLDRQFKMEGLQIQTASLHPGLVRTDIFREVSTSWYTRLQSAYFRWLGKDSREGAQTSIFLAVTSQDPAGGYFSDCAPTPWYKMKLGDLEWQQSLLECTKRIVFKTQNK